MVSVLKLVFSPKNLNPEREKKTIFYHSSIGYGINQVSTYVGLRPPPLGVQKDVVSYGVLFLDEQDLHFYSGHYPTG